MSSMNILGDLVNVTTSVTTAAKRVSLRNYSGVLFVLNGTSGATTVTITEANAASGGTSQTLAGTFAYWTQPVGGGAWTAGTGGVNGTSITSISGTGATLAVYIPQGALSDGFAYLAASHATGTFTYILGRVDVGRKITNLQDVTL